MPYVVTATWKAKPGEEVAVLELLRHIGAASREEPGCLLPVAAHRLDIRRRETFATISAEAR